MKREQSTESWLFSEEDEKGIFFFEFFTQGRSMTTTLLTWRGTWTPWEISRSSARSYGWRTSNSWTAISRNWRNSLFEETTRSSSLNTWVYDRIYIYRMNKSLFYVRNNSSRSSKRMEDEIKSAGVVVHVYFLERINRIIHFPSWIDPRQFLSLPSPRSQTRLPKTFRSLFPNISFRFE